MADEEEPEGPVVELGEAVAVEGQPLARVASRLTWPIEQPTILTKEGDSVVRTPDGPRTVTDVLESIDETYFETRQAFVDAFQSAVGTGPVATGDE